MSQDTAGLSPFDANRIKVSSMQVGSSGLLFGGIAMCKGTESKDCVPDVQYGTWPDVGRGSTFIMVQDGVKQKSDIHASSLDVPVYVITSSSSSTDDGVTSRLSSFLERQLLFWEEHGPGSLRHR